MQPEPQPPINDDQPQPSYQPEPQQPTMQPEPQSQPEQQTPTQPMPAPQQPAPIQQPAQDPGKLFSILGLICAFIFLQLPGLILSIIGLKKSKKAGFPTTLAIVGIVLNAIFMLLTLGILAAITMVAYNGVQQRAEDSEVVNTAMSIMNKAEIYGVESEIYPTLEQLRTSTGASQLTDADKAVLKDTDTPSGKDVGYKTCTDEAGTVTGASVYIYSITDQQVRRVGFVGNCESIVAPQ